MGRRIARRPPPVARRTGQGGGWAAGIAGGWLALLAAPAAAHGVTAQPVGDGRVTVTIADSAGAPLANESARVYAPGGGDAPAWAGSTGADGALSFAAPRDGVWRIDLIALDGHADRATVRVEHGLPVNGGAALPRWLLAISLTGNILAGIVLAAPRLRASVRPNRGGRS